MKPRCIAVLIVFLLPTSVCLADGNTNLQFSEIEHWSASEVRQTNPFSFNSAFNALRTVHPIIIAGLLLFLVLGACFLMTDEKEIELYLKIDFRPPKTDILN